MNGQCLRCCSLAALTKYLNIPLMTRYLHRKFRLRDTYVEPTMRPSCDDVVSLFYHLVREMVDHPEVALVKSLEQGHRLLVEVYVHPTDVRKIIGSKGRCANALRELLKKLTAPLGRPCTLDIIEPDIRRPVVRQVARDLKLQEIKQPVKRVVYLLERVVRALVSYPEEAYISETQGSQTTLLTIRLEPEDLPRVIGRRGRTIDAIRELARVLGGRHGLTCLIDIAEQGRGSGGPQIVTRRER